MPWQKGRLLGRDEACKASAGPIHGEQRCALQASSSCSTSHSKLPEIHSHAKAQPVLFYQTYLHDCGGGRSGHSRRRGRHLQADGAQARPRSRWPPLCTLRGSTHALSTACRQADMQASPAFGACRIHPHSCHAGFSCLPGMHSMLLGAGATDDSTAILSRDSLPLHGSDREAMP